MTMEIMEIESGQDEKIQELIDHIQRGTKARQLPYVLNTYRRVLDELSVTGSGMVLRGSRILVPKWLRRRTRGLAHVSHQGVLKANC